MPFERVAVIGDGGWGTALAVQLAQAPGLQELVLWSHFPEHATLLNESRINQKFLPGVHIPDAIRIISGEELATVRPQLLIFAVPTPFLRATAREVRSWLHEPVPLLSVVKGLETDTFLPGSEILRQEIDPPALAVLSGPSHAEEVARGMITLVSVASTDPTLAARIQELLTHGTFRVYTCADVTGVELGGALKNVIGVAAGMCDGLGYGDNTKSALITRAISEMSRLVICLGGEAQTLYGLSGVGDLITTCISPFGRNRKAGELLGKGQTVEQILEATETVAEGIRTTHAVYHLAQKYKIDMPITEAIYSVLYGGSSPQAAAEALMARALGPEHPA